MANLCPECAKRNGGLCAACIAKLVPSEESDRTCNIKVTDAELGNVGRLLPRFRDEANKVMPG